MAAALEDVRVRHVRVTNGTDEVWTDRYDGVPLTLQPGDTQTIPLDMALHFFGYAPGVDQATMLMHVANRTAKTDGEWGSIRADPALRKRVAEKFFQKFQIEPVSFKLVEEEARPRGAREAPVPASTDDEPDTIREPTAVKELAKTGMKQPDAEPVEDTGRGHPRRDPHGRRRE
jgi:hypothetical protein